MRRIILFFVLICNPISAQHVEIECKSLRNQEKNDKEWINTGTPFYYDLDKFIIHYDNIYANIHRSSVELNTLGRPILEIELYRGPILQNYFNENAYYPNDTLRFLRIQGARLSGDKNLNHKFFYFDIINYQSGHYEIYKYVDRPETAIYRSFYSP